MRGLGLYKRIFDTVLPEVEEYSGNMMDYHRAWFGACKYAHEVYSQFMGSICQKNPCKRTKYHAV